jgi:hypothetical protein
MNRSFFARRLWLLAVVLVAGLASGAPALAADGTFKSESGNIICGINPDNVVCVIKSGLNPAPPRATSCDGGDPVTNRLSLLATGAAEQTACAGDPGPLVDEATAKELPYGTTVANAAIGCAAFKFGIMCTNSQGHGFFLNRSAWRYF